MTSTIDLLSLKEGIELIKYFENCHLEAYPDPKTKGKPYTIGWGSTRKRDGSEFRLGERITQQEADSLFDHQLRTIFLPPLSRIPHIEEMTPEQVGALLSFAYNLGANFYGSKGFYTITKRLREKDWARVPSALLLYIDKGSDVEAGLRRRREAEGKLWNKGLLFKEKTMKRQIIALRSTLLKKQPLQSHLLAPAQRLEVPEGKGYKVLSISPADSNHSKVELDYGAGTWFMYNPHWRTITPGSSVSNSSGTSKRLNVIYFPQRDSATTHALRMCFSSSCAMLADYLKPDAIKVAEQEDDFYMRKFVFRYGDTTNPMAQIAALRDLGITAQYRQNLSQQDIISQIDKGIPVPIGFLHHGPVNSPRGGGHWVIVIGYDRNTGHYIVHDPYGELDVINGGYWGSTNGANQRYSFNNLNRRWMVEPTGNGAYRFAEGKGWGIIATSW